MLTKTKIQFLSENIFEYIFFVFVFELYHPASVLPSSLQCLKDYLLLSLISLLDLYFTVNAYVHRSMYSFLELRVICVILVQTACSF